MTENSNNTELRFKRHTGRPPWWMWAGILVAGVIVLIATMASAGTAPVGIREVVRVVLAVNAVLFSAAALIAEGVLITRAKRRVSKEK